MEEIEEVEQAERTLGSVRRYVETNLALHGEQQKLSFAVEEEQMLEEKVNEGVAAFQTALAEALEAAQELADPKVAAETEKTLEKLKQQLLSHVMGCRKALVSYRQRAKTERLEQARQSLLPQSPGDAKEGKMPGAGSAVDVTAALKRTRQVMSQEIERVSSVSKVLDDGRLSLRSSHEEYGNVNAEIAEVRKRLKALEWQARQDKIWIGAGLLILVSTVLFIVYERTGLILV